MRPFAFADLRRLCIATAMVLTALPSRLFRVDSDECENFCEIPLPKSKCIRNIHVLAGGNANENKVAE
jgi:hypothetical protein